MDNNYEFIYDDNQKIVINDPLFKKMIDKMTEANLNADKSEEDMIKLCNKASDIELPDEQRKKLIASAEKLLDGKDINMTCMPDHVNLKYMQAVLFRYGYNIIFDKSVSVNGMTPLCIARQLMIPDKGGDVIDTGNCRQ